jgi:YbbR domain-containing protein
MDRLLKNNTAAKILAFILALMLWMAVGFEERGPAPTIQEGHLALTNVEVQLLYDDEIYEVMEIDIDKIQVDLTGRRALLNMNMLRNEPYRIYADLRQLDDGRHRVALQYDGFPSELNVSLNPRQVTVFIERKEPRAFPFEIEYIGNARNGYRVETAQSIEEQVFVIAPISVLERVTSVKGIVRIDRIDESFVQQVQLGVFDEEGKELRAEVSPAQIEVTIPVISPSKTVPVVLNLQNQLPDGISFVGIEPITEQVTISAPLSTLDRIGQLAVPLDLSQMSQAQRFEYTVPLERDWHGVQPAQVEVEVRVAPTQRRTLSNLPINVRGLGDGYELDFVQPTNGLWSITLSGSAVRLQSVRAMDIEPTIDLTGLSEGEHIVSIDYRYPEHVLPVNENRTVTLRIESIEETIVEAEESLEEENEVVSTEGTEETNE